MNYTNYRENSKKYDFVDNKVKLITMSANRNLSEDEKLKKEIVLTTEIKICLMNTAKKETGIKTTIKKEKVLLDYFINRVDELENVYISK